MWRLILKLVFSPKAVIIDSTKLVTDRGRWLEASKGRFYGYKLHLISTENSIPIGFRVTIGSVHDVKMFSPLQRQPFILHKAKTVEYLIGDAAYDPIKAMEEAIGEGLKPLVKLKKRGKTKGKGFEVSPNRGGAKGVRAKGYDPKDERLLKEGIKMDEFPGHVRETEEGSALHSEENASCTCIDVHQSENSKAHLVLCLRRIMTKAH